MRAQRGGACLMVVHVVMLFVEVRACVVPLVLDRGCAASWSVLIDVVFRVTRMA